MENSAWISAIATVVIAIATIVYAVMTVKTLKSINDQIGITKRQLLENIRQNTLIIQPYFSISNINITLNPVADYESSLKPSAEYVGTLSIRLSIENSGLGPAEHVQIAAILVANLGNEQWYSGFFSELVPSVQKQGVIDVTCNDVDGWSHILISGNAKKESSYKSLQLFIFLLFQDISSQNHVQYFVFSRIPQILVNKFGERCANAKEVYDYIMEKARQHIDEAHVFRDGDQMISAMPESSIGKIVSDNIDDISNMLLKEDSVFLHTGYDSSTLISKGLPDPLTTTKSFGSLKKRLGLGKLGPKDKAIDVLVKMFTSDENYKDDSDGQIGMKSPPTYETESAELMVIIDTKKFS